MSLFFAAMFPDDVKGLVLVNMTGDPIATAYLAHHYHSVHAEACRRGSMDAVMKQELFAGMIALRPAHAELLWSVDSEEFIAVQEDWAAFLAPRDADPVVGITAEV